MENSLGICNLSTVPLRGNPAHSSEMISQLLFADTFEILEKDDFWLKIRIDHDGYEGWIDGKQMQTADPLQVHSLKKEAQFLTSEASTMVLKGGLKEPFYLAAGTTLPFFDNGKCKLGNDVFTVTSSNVFVANQEDFETNIIETAKIFLNVPYLWGGRTHAGIDCSGFSQMVFKMLGVQLKRDAWQQAEQGKTVDFLTEAKAGDLAFFDNQEGRITHVGVMLNNSQIIHASGRVKIDRIDNQGIFAADQNKYTHKLRIIKRYV
ncbi:NlpC/P60 family protein [Pedobacter alpinus]|uniref:NlpC/P60 family protein n=1 Tax=Pedobacter alpinus TaxID=1590643 RepID=A0ABW5TUQ9_9SPHI